MLLYAFVFVNAELPALIGIAGFSATDESAVGIHGLLLLAGVVVAVLLGLVLTVGPAADSALAGIVTVSRRSFLQWLALGLIAISVLALPVASSASYVHVPGWSFRRVLTFMSAVFATVSVASYSLERAIPRVARLFRLTARIRRPIVVSLRRRSATRQEHRESNAADARKEDPGLLQQRYPDHCPASHLPDGQDSAQARSRVNQRCSSADVDRQLALAGRTRAALDAARLPASRA